VASNVRIAGNLYDASKRISELEDRVARLEGHRFTRERTCRVCDGVGAIPGFLLGSVKTCPACHGKGRQ
jgi:DnaJ-class molecular chaperone